MLGLLLFISAVAVLIICARMRHCHELLLWVCDCAIHKILREKKTPWKLEMPILSKLVLLYVSHTWRVVLPLMIDSQCRCAIIRCDHMAGEHYRNWTLTVSSEHAPFGGTIRRRCLQKKERIRKRAQLTLSVKSTKEAWMCRLVWIIAWYIVYARGILYDTTRNNWN